MIFLSAAYLDISVLQLNSSVFSYTSEHAWYSKLDSDSDIDILGLSKLDSDSDTDVLGLSKLDSDSDTDFLGLIYRWPLENVVHDLDEQAISSSWSAKKCHAHPHSIRWFPFTVPVINVNYC